MSTRSDSTTYTNIFFLLFFCYCVLCHVSGVRCQMSDVRCQMSHVICRMSHATCNLSQVDKRQQPQPQSLPLLTHPFLQRHGIDAHSGGWFAQTKTKQKYFDKFSIISEPKWLVLRHCIIVL